MDSAGGALQVMIEALLGFVVGKNSHLMTLHRTSCLISQPPFVYYESSLIQSTVFLIWIPYPQLRYSVYAGTICLLVELAGRVNCLVVVETWCNTKPLTKVF